MLFSKCLVLKDNWKKSFPSKFCVNCAWMEVEKYFYKIAKRRNNEEEFSRICSEQVVHAAVSEVDLKASTCKLQEVKCVFLFGSLANQEVWLSILAEPVWCSGQPGTCVCVQVWVCVCAHPRGDVTQTLRLLSLPSVSLQSKTLLSSSLPLSSSLHLSPWCCPPPSQAALVSDGSRQRTSDIRVPIRHTKSNPCLAAQLLSDLEKVL